MTEARLVRCPQCGAAVDALLSSAVTRCHYCGGQLQLTRAGAPWREVELLGLNAHVVSAATLKACFERTLHAVDGARQDALGCAQVHFNGPAVSVAATDGSRLAFVSQSCTIASAHAPFLLPRRAIERLLGELAEPDAMLDLAFGDDRLFVRVADRELSFVYGAGAFPNYRAVFPASLVSALVIPTADIAVALADGAKSAWLHLRGNHVVVSASREVTLPFAPDGQPLSVYFNPTFLLDSVLACRSDTVRLGFAAPLSPIVVQPSEPNGFMGAVMPMKPPK